MDTLLVEQNTLVDRFRTSKRNFNKTSAARRTYGYVSTKLEAILSFWQTFCQNDAALRQYKEFASTTYEMENIFETTEEEYCVFSADLKDILHAIPTVPNTHPQSPTSPIPPSAPAIRLPQITLPTFSGDYASWSAFHDMFVSLIDSNASLTSVQKLHYLKSNLRDQAAHLLRHTQITNDNYETAWTALKTRFANKRILVNSQLSTLTKQPCAQSESARSVRELIDTTNDCVNALKNQSVAVDTWDPILLFLLVQKLSTETHAAWELDQEGVSELPSYDNFIEFLENRFRMLESLATRTHSHAKPATPRNIKAHVSAVASNNTSARACAICSESHFIRACSTFLRMSIADRRTEIKKHRCCFNCLSPGHSVSECRNRSNCQTCNKRHHTLLHDSSSGASIAAAPAHHSFTPASVHQASATTPTPVISPLGPAPALHSLVPAPTHVSSHIAAPLTTSSSPAHVLLATAIVKAVSSTGALISLRALIDQGSQVTFISENAAQLLRLKSIATGDCWSISGIGGSPAGRTRNIVQLQLRSSYLAGFELSLNALVIKRVTGMIPQTQCATESWPHIAGIELADPLFNVPGAIDILLGANAYPQIIQSGLLRGPIGSPIAQATVFGWILSGSTSSSTDRQNQMQTHLSSMHTCIDIDARLQSFWEIEHNHSNESSHTDEEVQCEQHYAATHTRAPDGRYIVRLPLRENAQLGESRNTALHRFTQTERRLQSNEHLRSAYIDFMREYISLGHMKLAKPSDQLRYFIPHHAVFKDSSTTTKVRVVFDASAKSSNGYALNEIMLIGPKIQNDLSVTLLRWRKFPIAFIADVEKMYRQIMVNESDHHLQHIFWRESPQAPLREYALQTVTYGTSCAPYLAVRTLQQLANDHKHTHSAAAKIAREDFYVDDLMSGAYNTDAAITIRRQLCALMSAGGLNLRKWVSNNTQLLNDIPSCDRELQQPLNIDLNNTVTALGIIWNPSTDKFHFKLKLPDIISPPTKRNVLSDISRLFDPLGWLAPTIIRAKVLMQNLWLKGVSWDEHLPVDVSNHWQLLRKDLINVHKIEVDRWIQYDNTSIELHGFSDASNCAYAAAIYARTTSLNGHCTTTLLTAKTRVAPLKQVSIPRLELCGAVLVAELLHATKTNLQIDDINMHAWTDSSIVIHWIHSQPSRWKTFVANRVSTIQQLVPMSCWRHVPTAENPADCASRGLDADTLHSFKLWWSGPTWLAQPPDTWPQQKLIQRQPKLDEHEHEQRVTSILATPVISHPTWSSSLLQSISSLQRLLRIFSYCRRICMRRAVKPSQLLLTAAELQYALLHFIYTSQHNTFEHEINLIKHGKPLSVNSKIISLNPMLDQNGILRVGGRLINANLTYEEKHPIILHHKCNLSTLLIRQQHFTTMHGGTQLVLGLLRKKYFITNARDTVRRHIHRCITCHRFNAASASQLMGDLPPPRVKFTRAFTHTGVDYAGPIDLRMSKGRGNASYKGYISVFVCLCTKAIHIEAVSDLTSAAFIAAYRRFVSRRGLPAHMYSDNGTNFIGASKVLRQTHDDMLPQVKADIIDMVTHDNTEWHFIPPSSPHFGGLWEAGVKSLKHHLKRSIGTHKLTYEELSTLLTQIEACLNSRPLTQLTSDPDDLAVLTPGHFLTGDALLAVPDLSTEPANINLLTRWQIVQRLQQHICNRWKSEYLSRLQHRPKWVKASKNLQVGDLVLLKDPSFSPSFWPLARITETHPGDDGLVRVVTVRTMKSTFKRSITKLSPLPQ